jgi:hypothetical protein
MSWRILEALIDKKLQPHNASYKPDKLADMSEIAEMIDATLPSRTARDLQEARIAC